MKKPILRARSAVQEQASNSVERPFLSSPVPISPVHHRLSNLTIQPKLLISPSRSSLEQEADRTATHIMRYHTTSLPIREHISPTISRATSSDSHLAVSPHVSDALNQERGKGHALPDMVREPMEQAFGQPFNHVHLHTDPAADQYSRALQAKAFTVGNDIFFRAAAYQPATTTGQELIAHELTHVVQQAPGQLVQRSADDLDEWSDTIWNPVTNQVTNAVFELVESINQGSIEDTGAQDPGLFLQQKYEREEEDTMEDDNNQDWEEKFANEEHGGINTIGLRTQLDALSDAARGRVLELEFLRKQAVENRYWMQAGAIEKSGGDVSVRAGDNWSDERTYQFKSSRSESQGAIDTVMRKAAEQLRGQHGETPYHADRRIISIEIVNPANPFPGTPGAPARATQGTFVAQFRTRLGSIHNGNLLNGVDAVEIKYVTPVPMTNATTITHMTQNLNGQGGLLGAAVFG